MLFNTFKKQTEGTFAVGAPTPHLKANEIRQ